MARQVVAQPAGGAHDDMAAAGQRPRLAAAHRRQARDGHADVDQLHGAELGAAVPPVMVGQGREADAHPRQIGVAGLRLPLGRRLNGAEAGGGGALDPAAAGEGQDDDKREAAAHRRGHSGLRPPAAPPSAIDGPRGPNAARALCEESRHD